MLITAQELKALLADPQLRVMDCRFALDNPLYGGEAYDKDHIPGAQYAHLDRDLSSPVIPGQTGRHPLPDARQFLARVRRWSIDTSTSVIAYDDGSGAFAARLWWLLNWIGIRNVRLLDGGYKAWLSMGGPVDSATPAYAPSAYDAVPDASRVVTAAEVLALRGNRSAPLIDARGRPRFRGEVEPIDPVAGHIPGAQCFPHEENLNASGHFKSAEELHARFSSLQGKQPICYCGSGVTACHNIFAMTYAGFEQPRLYAGSWSEWITDPRRPRAVGDENPEPSNRA